MKAVLRFDLPEDEEDFRMAFNAIKWWHTVYDLDRWLQEQMERDGTKKTELDAYQKTRDMLRDMLADNGISLEDMS